MKRLVMIIFLIAPFLLLAQSERPAKRILMVVSSYGKDRGESRPGYEFDEFSQAYLIFRNNGLDIDIASPKGGKVDHLSLDSGFSRKEAHRLYLNKRFQLESFHFGMKL